MGEEHRRKMSEGLKEKWKDPTYRKKMSEALKKSWKNPEYRRKMTAKKKRYWREWRQKKKKEILKALKKNPEQDRRLLAKQLGIHGMTLSKYIRKLEESGELEHVNYISVVSRRNWKNPEFRERMSKLCSRTMKEKWQRPEFRKKVSEAMSKTMKKKYKEDPIYHRKIVKLLSPPFKKSDPRISRICCRECGKIVKVDKREEHYKIEHPQIKFSKEYIARFYDYVNP